MLQEEMDNFKENNPVLVNRTDAYFDSIEESYHQKIKDDTNYLAKQKKRAQESGNFDGIYENKEGETMYSLKIRQSYNQMAQHNENRFTNYNDGDDSQREFDLAIEQSDLYYTESVEYKDSEIGEDKIQ